MENPILPERVPRVHLARDVGKVVDPKAGSDRSAELLEQSKVVHRLETEEVERIKRGPLQHNRNLLVLNALHNPQMELARKLSELIAIVRRQTPITDMNKQWINLATATNHTRQYAPLVKTTPNLQREATTYLETRIRPDRSPRQRTSRSIQPAPHSYLSIGRDLAFLRIRNLRPLRSENSQ